MLSLKNPFKENEQIPINIPDNERFVTHTFNGYDTLTFEVERKNQINKYILEEVEVTDETNNYLIKKIDKHSDFVTVECSLNLDDWERRIIYSYRKVNATLQEVLNDILPNGWITKDVDKITNRGTIEGYNNEPLQVVSPLEILNTAADSFDCIFNFDTKKKILKVINIYAYEVSDIFFTDELNLNDLGFNGDSSNFATRLYAYGAVDESGNPITFASINQGKEYIEDFTYSDKIISVGWKDDRYTNPYELMYAAIDLLSQISYPTRSYTCDISFVKDAEMYKVVTLIDREQRTRIQHRIVEYKEYPDHSYDSITLSSLAPNLTNSINSAINSSVQQSNTRIDELNSKIESEKEKVQNLETNKVSFTDYATSSKSGVIKTGNNFEVNSNGIVQAKVSTKEEYESLDNNSFISKGTLENSKENIVKSVLENNVDYLKNLLGI